MADQPQTLAQLIKAKYPGKYDDLSDTDLEQRILAKYPQYADLPRTQSIPGAPNGLPGVPKAPNPILGENVVSQHRMVPGPGGGIPQDYDLPESQVAAGQNLTNAALGTAATGLGLATAPLATIGSLAGGYGGGKGTRAGAKALGAGETVQDAAETGGNLLGGIAGGMTGSALQGGLNNLVANIARDEQGNVLSPKEILWAPVKKGLDKVVPLTEEQQAARDAASFASDAKPISGASVPIKNSPYFDKASYQEGILARKTPSGIPVGNPTPFAPGSASQESGFTPALTKVPIRPMPTTPLTPESVPGPDTSGKGNLLTPLAKTGDPRAAAELLRRGRRVLFVPDADSPKYISSDDFADLLQRLQE